VWNALPSLLVLALSGTAPYLSAEEVAVQSIVPILVVDRIEPSLSLWVDRLGFEVVAEVREGEELGFALLARGETQLMYQTRASLQGEVDRGELPPAAIPGGATWSVVYLRVDDLEEVRGRLQGVELLVPHRRTSYGAEETWLREPGGHLVGFAARHEK
jgi:catechol 2,3-dioxygenase-like lactoylglutathione lyase family enzyme